MYKLPGFEEESNQLLLTKAFKVHFPSATATQLSCSCKFSLISSIKPRMKNLVLTLKHIKLINTKSKQCILILKLYCFAMLLFVIHIFNLLTYQLYPNLLFFKLFLIFCSLCNFTYFTFSLFLFKLKINSNN